MVHFFQHRGWHHAILLAAGFGIFLANLGTPSLWDKDEGRNATAALEMLKSGDYVVPHFNSELRVDKPALLYWLQVAAYRLFGISEFSARLPSALAALLTVLLCYELGRSLFGKTSGLLAALMVCSAPLMCGLARFANPDALLQLSILAIMFCFWRTRSGSVLWFVAMGVAAGLAVLAKGPVGVVLPGAAIALFCFWNGQVWTLLRPAYRLTAAACLLVALPWYVMVALETKAKFLTGFLLEHNVNRFLAPMENHHGSLLYYPAALLVGTAPWSYFWWLLCRPTYQRLRPAPAAADANVPAIEGSRIRENAGIDPDGGSTPHSHECGYGTNAAAPRNGRAAEPDSQASDAAISAHRFLVSWLVMVVLFFSVSATKLPSYVLPAMVPWGLLVAHQMIRWCRGELQVSSWLMYVSLAGVASMGLIVVAGTLIASGTIPLLRGRIYPGLERLAPMGLVPIVGGLIGLWLLRNGRRTGVVWALTLTGIAFTTPLALWASTSMDPFKAPRSLLARTQSERTELPIDIYCWNVGHLPSLNFYARRDLTHCDRADQFLSHLSNPTPFYAILPARDWEIFKSQVHVPIKELGRQHDMLCNETLVVVSNR